MRRVIFWFVDVDLDGEVARDDATEKVGDGGLLDASLLSLRVLTLMGEVGDDSDSLRLLASCAASRFSFESF